jgi:PAS domain S-box-containing protein
MDILGKFRFSKADDSPYRHLIEAIEDYAIYMLDRTGVVTSWNSGAQRVNGFTADEIVGENFLRFYTEDDQRSGVPARVLEAAARDGRYENEGWRVRKDGTQFWAFVVVDPIRNRSGEIVGFSEITRDLTERKAAEENLWRSEAQFRLLVQGVSDYAICMLDTEGRVTSWNLGAQRIKGYRSDEIIGQHFSRFYTEEDRAAGMPQKALESAMREGRFEKEAERVRKDGRRFWAHVVIDPIRDDAGELIGYAKITRDITERKQAQEKLEKAREFSLQAQKLEAIGQLTGGIAHDFNNLLTAVLGSLELLRKRLLRRPEKHSPARKCRAGCATGYDPDQAHACVREKLRTQQGSDRRSRTRAWNDRPSATVYWTIIQPRDPFSSLTQADRSGHQSAGAGTPQSHPERPRCYA